MKIVVGFIVICSSMWTHADACLERDERTHIEYAPANTTLNLARSETLTFLVDLEEPQLIQLFHTDLSLNWVVSQNDASLQIENRVGPTGSSFAVLEPGQHTICVWTDEQQENAGTVRLSQRSNTAALTFRAKLDAERRRENPTLTTQTFVQAAELLLNERFVKEAADTYVAQGLLQLNAGLSQEAEMSFGRALHIATTHDLAIRLPWIRYWLGNALAAGGQPQPALDSFKTALTESNSTYLDARLESYVGLNYLGLGQLNDALVWLNRAQQNEENLRNPTLQANVVNNLGGLHLRRGDADLAGKYFDRAATTYTQLNNGSFAITALVNAATAYRSKGDYTATLNRLHRALALDPAAGFERGEVLQSLGNLHADFENWARASDYYTSANKEIAETQHQLAIARGQWLTGTVELHQGNVPKGVNELLQAIKSFNELGGVNGELRTACTLAQHYLKSSNLKAARTLLTNLNDSMQQARTENLGAALACLTQTQANIEIARGNHSDGERLLIQAAAEFDAIAATPQQIGAMNDLAKHYLRNRQDENALAIINSTELLLARTPVQHGVGLDRRTIANSRRDWVDLKVAFEHSRSANNKAIEALSTSIRNRGDVESTRADLPMDNATQLLSRKSVLLNSGQTGPELQKVMLSLARLATEQTENTAAPKKNNKPVNVEELRSALPANTTVLYYHLAPNQSYLWLLSRENISSYTLISGDQIHTLANNLHTALAQPGGNGKWRQPANMLARAVLDPVWPDISNRNIVIVADSNLVQIPFATLPIAERDGATLLGQWATVSYSPWLGTPNSNPYSKPLRATMVTFESPETNTNLPGIDRERAALESLTGAELLIEKLDLKQKSSVTQTLEKPTDILHLSAHAYAHLREPGISAITAFEDPFYSLANDQALTALEIGRMQIQSRVVVLNACETARVTDHIGNEANSLTGAFLNAGAEHVVSSLWRVPGVAAATFSKEFYKALNAGDISIEAALSSAQDKMRSMRQWRHPYFWSGFVLTSKPSR